MKKRDTIIITICSAATLVCIALTFWGNLKNDGILTIDAFMGVIATLIGICATIIVGFQIASHLELKDIKSQVKNLQEEREKLEAISRNINSTRSDLSNAFVALGASTSNEYLQIVCMISTIIVDEYTDERKSGTLLSRYKHLHKALQNIKDPKSLESKSINRLCERLQDIKIPDDIENRDEILKLHYETILILKKGNTATKE